MALDDVPLNDAGRDYYNRQFGSRVQNIRKYGATPPTARKAGCLGTGGAAGGGIFAIIVVIRIIAAVAWVGSSSYDSGYNNSYNYEPANVTIPDPAPQVDWKNDIPVDPPVDPNALNPNAPIFIPQDPPALPPDDPLIRPDPPAVVPDDPPPAPPDPNPPAPAVPDDDKPAGDDK